VREIEEEQRGRKRMVKRKRYLRERERGKAFDHRLQYPAVQGGILLRQFCFIKK